RGEVARPGGGEIPQRLLLHHHAARRQPRERGPGLGKLPALGGEAWGWGAWLPPVALLHRQVPDVPGVRAVAQERSLLRRRGVQPITAHVFNLVPSCDNEGRKRRFLPGLKAEASTPRKGEVEH